MNIDGYVHARVITPHDRYCEGRWTFDAGWGLDGNDPIDRISIVLCDARGRRSNGGRVFYQLCCVESYRCKAEAIVSKAYLHDQAVDLLTTLEKR